jgi:hypothetical protein
MSGSRRSRTLLVSLLRRNINSGHFIAYLVLAGLWTLPLAICSAADFSGRVVGVSDGDTITVLHDKRAVKIELLALLDLPFHLQQHLRSLVFQRIMAMFVLL